MNFKNLGVILVTSLFLFGCISPTKIKKVEEPSVQSLEASENSKSIQLKKIVVKLKRGENLGRYRGWGGILTGCEYEGEVIWGSNRNRQIRGSSRHIALDLDMFTDTFNEELENYSFKTVGNTPDALFEDSSTWKPEILVAGLIQEVKVNICYPLYSGYTFSSRSWAEVFLKINWQIYSNLDRTVIHTVTSEGSGGTGERPMDAGTDFATRSAFAQAIRTLLADKKFREIVSRGGESLK